MSEKTIKSFCNGKIIVVVPKDLRDFTVPLFCRICAFPMKTKEDAVEYRKRKACEHCSYEFQGNPPPKKKSKEWQKYIESRRLRNRTIIKLK